MRHKNAVVGFSVNAELELAVQDTPGPKKVLNRMGVCLSGSSGNITIALQNLGAKAHLLGLVAVSELETLESRLLKETLKKSEVPFTPLKVLTQTNICVVPVIGNKNGVAWGKRNKIVHNSIPRALKDLTDFVGIGPRTFSIVTSLRLVEIVFAKTLLARTQTGFRVLNAKDTLCARKEFKRILQLVDLLVLNQREFDETGMKLSELHKRGPRIIVVTHDSKGGIFSFNSGHSSHFKPHSFTGGKFETGAGDWFLGALVSELIRLEESALTIKSESFQKVVDFAARVAGKKITMPGGGNGPTRFQLGSERK